MKTGIRHLIVMIAGIATVLYGCSNPFAPPLGEIGGTSSAILTARETPDEVLENFRFAYIYGDSLVYSEIIDTSFVFLYFDPNLEGTGRFDSWGRDVELRTTAGLFRAIGNISVEWNSTVEERYWSTGTDSVISSGYFSGALVASISKSFTLKLGSEIQIAGTAVFTFGRRATTSAWRITRWRDDSIF